MDLTFVMKCGIMNPRTVNDVKISEIENIIEQGNFSEKIFADFQTALKRVPKKLRCQHCYTMAYHLKEKRPQDGVRLIQFGLANYESDWVDQMRAYQNLGGIYETCGDYPSAKTAYEQALAAVPDEQKEDYLPSLSMNALRAELHCSAFSYSEYLDELYQAVVQADEFQAAFRSFSFYRAIAELIIAKEQGDLEMQKQAYNAAMLAMDGDRVTGMDLLLRRHRYKDDARATKQAIAFLKRNKR